MATDDPTLGLDASQFNAEVDNVAAKMGKLNLVFTQAIDKFNQFSNISDGTTISFGHVDDAGNKFNVTLKQTEEGLEVVNKSLKIGTDLLANNAAKVKEADAAYNSLQAQIKRADAAIAGIISRGEEFRRQQVLAGQQSLYNSLASDADRLQQHQQFVNERLAAQSALSSKLNAVRREGVEISAREEAAALRQSRLQATAQAVGRRLTTSFASPTGGSTILSTPAEKQAVAQNIASVQALIEKGSISASRALSVINSAASGSGEVFTGVEGRVARLAINLSNNAQKMGGSFRQAVADMDEDGNKNIKTFDDVKRTGQEAANKLLISWRDLGRIFVIQAFHTVVGKFVQALGQAVQTSRDFEIRISEIRTISQDNQLTFNKWADSVRALSDQFGAPILQTAEGLYEAISNQVTKGADAAGFMAKALAFAQVTVSSTADSVNLLSSAMNAYKFNINDVDRISAQFFKTIDLGRVRAQDLANEFGRVAPVAASLGITFEELNAAIATITIQGVTPAETLTSIFGVMNKLLKPTKEMGTFLTSLGFASGQAAIATLGFDGVLRKITEAAAAGNEELSQLFNDIRAVRGITAITRAMDNYGATLNAIRNDSQEKFIKAQEIINESAGKRFEIEINRIKNAFIGDFGRQFIEIIGNIGFQTDETGKRIHGFSDTLLSAFDVVKAAGTIFIAWRASILLTNAALAAQSALLAENEAFVIITGTRIDVFTGALAALRYRLALINPDLGLLAAKFATLGAAGGIAAAIPAIIGGLGALAAGYFITKQAEQSFVDDAVRKHEELSGRLAQDVEKQTADFTKGLRDRETLLAQALKNRLQSDLTYVSSANAVYSKLSKGLAAQFKEMEKSIKDTFDGVISTAQTAISGLEKAASTAAENIKKAKENLNNQQEGITGGQFNRQIKLLPEPEQIKAMFAEINRLNADAAKKLTSPTGDANVAQENLRLATKMQADADRLVTDLQDKQVELAKKRKEIEEQITKLTITQSGQTSTREARDNLNEINKLERESKTASGRRQTDIQKELATRKEAAREALTAARDSATDNSQGERLRDLQEQLKTITDQQKVIGSQKSLDAANTEQLAKRNDLTDAFVKMNETIKKQTEDQAKLEKDRLERLRTVLNELAGFKLPEIKTVADAQAALGKFDSEVKTAIAQGLNDPRALKELAAQRVAISRQADIDIAKSTSDRNAESLAKEKENFLKQIGDLDAARKAAEQKKVGAVQTLFNAAATVQAFFPSQTALDTASAKTGIDTGAMRDFKVSIKDFGVLVDKLRTDPSNQNVQAAQKAFDAISVLLADRSRGFSGVTVLNSLVEQKSAATSTSGVILRDSNDPKQRLTLETLQNEVGKAFSDLLTGPKTAKQLADDQAVAEKRIAQLNLDLKKAQDQVNAQTDSTTATVNFTAKINESANNMLRLTEATRLAAARLESLAQGTPVTPIGKARGGIIPLWRPMGTDTIPAMLTPGEFVVNARAASQFRGLLEQINYRSQGGPITSVTSGRMLSVPEGFGEGNINIGDIHVHGVPVSGDVRVDARAIANEIHSQIRLGMVKSFNRSE